MSPALLVVVVISALSAADATLGATPAFDDIADGGRLAQLRPVKDRESAGLRSARVHDEDRSTDKAPQRCGDGGYAIHAADDDRSFARPAGDAIFDLVTSTSRQLPLTLLDLPPPVR